MGICWDVGKNKLEIFLTNQKQPQDTFLHPIPHFLEISIKLHYTDYCEE